MKTGIYMIGTPSGRIYVGSAVNFSWRKNRHLHDLRKGVHHNRRLQRSFNKYGEEALTFVFVKECSRDELLTEEQKLIDATPASLRLNSCLQAGSTLGMQFSDEHRAKLSAARKRAATPPERVQKARRAMTGKKTKANTSGYPGVTAHRRKWAVRISVRSNSVRHVRHLGTYETPSLAYAMRLVYLAAMPEGGLA